MPKYNDFDLDLQEGKMEEMTTLGFRESMGPYKSCYIICQYSEQPNCTGYL